MADFRTHLMGGVFAGLGLSVVGYELGLVSWRALPLITLAATIGGIAPDVDSDSGRPQRILFGLATVIVPTVVLLRVDSFGPDLRSLGAWTLMALAVWFPARWIFRVYTVHRGMFHSAPAVLIFGSLCYLLVARRFDGPRLQMGAGIAGAVGYLVHLVLDELWSVDFEGRRIRVKRSLGTATKFFGSSWHDNVATWMAALVLGGLVLLGLRGYDLDDLLSRVDELDLPIPAVQSHVREAIIHGCGVLVDQPGDVEPEASRARSAANQGS